MIEPSSHSASLTVSKMGKQPGESGVTVKMGSVLAGEAVAVTAWRSSGELNAIPASTTLATGKAPGKFHVLKT
jgi:hypothetical protein